MAGDLPYLYRLLTKVEIHTIVQQTSPLLLREGRLGLNLQLAGTLPALEGMELPWTEGTPVLATARQLLPLGRNMLLMGILDLTPDSFSNGSRYVTVDTTHAQALLLVQQGAHVLDTGRKAHDQGLLLYRLKPS